MANCNNATIGSQLFNPSRCYKTSFRTLCSFIICSMSCYDFCLLVSWQIALDIKHCRGQENSILVSVSVFQVRHPGSSPIHSVCFRNVKFYRHVIKLSPPVPTTGLPCQLLSCLCYNACYLSKGYVGHGVPLAGFCLSLYSLDVLNRDVDMIQTNKIHIVTSLWHWNKCVVHDIFSHVYIQCMIIDRNKVLHKFCKSDKHGH